jgi:hypothetical protein
MAFALILAAAPMRWADPATWPWVVWAWLAILLVGFAKPLWRWLRRRRAQGWPAAPGRIESVKVRKRRPFSISTSPRGGRLLYTAELAYSYSLEGRSAASIAVVFPLDQRWLYYETEYKFLNEARADLYSNLNDNEFLVTVPEPRKESETRPILLTTAFDLHLHDRGSVSFPAETIVGQSIVGTLFDGHDSAPHRQSNLAPEVWTTLKQAFSLNDPPP